MVSKKKNVMQPEREINRKEEKRNVAEPVESAGYVASVESSDHSPNNATESEIEIEQRAKVDTATQIGSDVDTSRDFLPPELTLAPMDFVLDSARGEAKSFVLLQVKREKCNDGKTQKEQIFFRMEADINPKWMIAQERQQRKTAEVKKTVVFKSRPKQRIPRPKFHPKPAPKPVKKIDESKQKTPSKNIKNEKLSNKKGKNVQLPSKDKTSKGVLKKTGKSIASTKTGKKEKTPTKVKTSAKGVPQGRSTIKTGTKGAVKRSAVTITGKKTATIPKIKKNNKAIKPVGKQGANTKSNTANKSRKTATNKVTSKTTTKVQSSSGRQQSKPTTTNKKTARAPVASHAKGPPTAPSKVKASATTSKNQEQQKSTKPPPSSQRAANSAPKNEKEKQNTKTKAEATPKQKPAGVHPEPPKPKVPIKPALIQKPQPKKIPKQPVPKTKSEDIKQEKKQQEIKKDDFFFESSDEPKITEIPLKGEVQHLNEGPVPSEDESKINSGDSVDVNKIEEEIIIPEVVLQPEIKPEDQVEENKTEIIVPEEISAPLEIEPPVTESVTEPEVTPIPETPKIESVIEVTIVEEEEPLENPPHMCNLCGYIVQEHCEVKDEGDAGETLDDNEAEKSQEPELCQKCCKTVIKVVPDSSECINCLGYLGNDTQFELKFDPIIRNLVAICSICKGPLKIDQKVRNKPPVFLRETRSTLSAAFAEMVGRLERIALENDESPLGAVNVTSYHDDYQPYVLNVRPRPRAGFNIPDRPRFTHTSAYSQEFKPLPFIKPENFFGRRKFSGLGQVRM